METLGPSMSISLAQAICLAPKFTEPLLCARLCAGVGGAGLSTELAVLWGDTPKQTISIAGDGYLKEGSVRVVLARGIASGQMRGIRASFLEEVAPVSYLEEGLSDSQVTKDKGAL